MSYIFSLEEPGFGSHRFNNYIVVIGEPVHRKSRRCSQNNIYLLQRWAFHLPSKNGHLRGPPLVRIPDVPALETGSCGRRTTLLALLPSGQIAKLGEKTIEERSPLAPDMQNSECGCREKHTDGLRRVSKGRAFRPAMKSGLPIISEVAPSELTGDFISTAQSTRSLSGPPVGRGLGLSDATEAVVAREAKH